MTPCWLAWRDTRRLSVTRSATSISGGVIGAIAALAECRDTLDGEVVVMGCPADEIHSPETVARGSGKALGAAAGAWDDIDAAMYVHPESINTVSLASLWMRRVVG